MMRSDFYGLPYAAQRVIRRSEAAKRRLRKLEPPRREIMADVEKVEVTPEAWLIRETRNGKTSILCGHMFKSEERAQAAALRLTNQWSLCQAFPVVSLATLSPTPTGEVTEPTIAQRLAEIDAYRAGLPPEERKHIEAEELAAQRESWVRGMAPCEHGVADFEDCAQCRNPSPTENASDAITPPVEDVVGGTIACPICRGNEDQDCDTCLRTRFLTVEEYRAALTALPDVEAMREALDSAVATLLAVRATASDLDAWEASADHFHKLCGAEVRKANAALKSQSALIRESEHAN